MTHLFTSLAQLSGSAALAAGQPDEAQTRTGPGPLLVALFACVAVFDEVLRRCRGESRGRPDHLGG